MPEPRRSHRKPRARQAPRPQPPDMPAAETGWDPVAAWYDKLVGESGSDYHRQVIIPAAMRMLAPRGGESVIDVCCGQGVMVRPLLDAGVARITAVDASPRLIAAAKARHGGDRRVSFVVADACVSGAWADAAHDAAVCLMAVHDVADVDSLFANIALALRPGGHAVFVLMHPCFRIPKSTHWGWDGDQKIQYRRIDSYGAPKEIPVTTHPGRENSRQTLFYHRPLAVLLNGIGRAGMAVAGCEELFSHRRSQATGPFSKAEHRAAIEIPVFLALKAVKP
jgi:SAM-dependent methyltransferase